MWHAGYREMRKGARQARYDIHRDDTIPIAFSLITTSPQNTPPSEIAVLCLMTSTSLRDPHKSAVLTVL